MSDIKWVKSADYLVVIVPGKAPISLDAKSDVCPKVEKAIIEKDDKKIRALLFPEEKIKTISGGKMEMDGNGVIKVEGSIVDPVIQKYIKIFEKGNLSIDPLVNLAKKIQLNESSWVREQLSRFLRDNTVPITPDGCFIGYKGVKRSEEGLVDCYSGTFCHDIGTVVRMDRADVNSDPRRSCEAGLHVAAHGYVKDCYNDNTHIAVKVDPIDVVSVPYDYDNQKMRTCGYEVLALMGSKEPIEDYIFPWSSKPKKGFDPKLSKKPRGKYQKNFKVDLKELPARQIFDLVMAETNNVITVGQKNKDRVIKHAIRIFKENNYKVDKTIVHFVNPPSIEIEAALNLSHLSANQIIELVKKKVGVPITISSKSKKAVLKQAKQILKDNGF